MKKRGAIYSVVALMLCVAVYLNWYYAKTGGDYGNATDYQADGKVLGESILVDKVDGEAQNQGSAKAGEYFSQARLSRQQARDEAVSILTKTAESETATQEARTAASTGIQVMADNAVVESRIENLVIAKGYADCVAFINDNGVNVIVNKTENGLTDTDVARIRDIVISEANVTADAIKIIETEYRLVKRGKMGYNRNIHRKELIRWPNRRNIWTFGRRTAISASPLPPSARSPPRRLWPYPGCRRWPLYPRRW